MGALRDELAELLGPEGLASLAEARGGRREYIPKRIPPGHWLGRALGREKAEALASRYGGCRLDIPRTPPARGRNRRIRELRRLGWSVPRVAAETGLSERWVRRILSRNQA